MQVANVAQLNMKLERTTSDRLFFGETIMTYVNSQSQSKLQLLYGFLDDARVTLTKTRYTFILTRYDSTTRCRQKS